MAEVAVDIGSVDVDMVVVPPSADDRRQPVRDGDVEHAEPAEVVVGAILIPVPRHVAGPVQGALVTVVPGRAVSQIAAVHRLQDVAGLLFQTPDRAPGKTCHQADRQRTAGYVLSGNGRLVLKDVVVVVGREAIARILAVQHLIVERLILDLPVTGQLIDQVEIAGDGRSPCIV